MAGTPFWRELCGLLGWPWGGLSAPSWPSSAVAWAASVAASGTAMGEAGESGGVQRSEGRDGAELVQAGGGRRSMGMSKGRARALSTGGARRDSWWSIGISSSWRAVGGGVGWVRKQGGHPRGSRRGRGWWRRRGKRRRRTRLAVDEDAEQSRPETLPGALLLKAGNCLPHRCTRHPPDAIAARLEAVLAGCRRRGPLTGPIAAVHVPSTRSSFSSGTSAHAGSDASFLRIVVSHPPTALRYRSP